MKTNLKIAILASTILLLGGIFTIAQKSTVSGSEQLISTCPGGGYPQVECEIIDGKRVCHRHCLEYFPKG
jgi:hypothetical protein